MGNSLIFGYIRTEEIQKIKEQQAEYIKKNNECMEKFNTIINRLRDLERVYETFINDNKIQEFKNKLERLEKLDKVSDG